MQIKFQNGPNTQIQMGITTLFRRHTEFVCVPVPLAVSIFCPDSSCLSKGKYSAREAYSSSESYPLLRANSFPTMQS